LSIFVARADEPGPEQKPVGIPLLDLTMDQWMDLEDEPTRRDRV
jgi:hypothetical protein